MQTETMKGHFPEAFTDTVGREGGLLTTLTIPAVSPSTASASGSILTWISLTFP